MSIHVIEKGPNLGGCQGWLIIIYQQHRNYTHKVPVSYKASGAKLNLQILPWKGSAMEGKCHGSAMEGKC